MDTGSGSAKLPRSAARKSIRVRAAAPGSESATAAIPAFTPAVPCLRLAGTTGSEAIAAPLPATGVLLVGTPSTARSLALQLASLPDTPVVAGWVRIGADQSPSLPPGSINIPCLGPAGELAMLHARYRFRAAVVSLPVSMGVESAKLRRMLDQLDIPARFVPTFEDLLAGRFAEAGAELAGVVTPETPEAAIAVGGGRGAGGGGVPGMRAHTTLDLAQLIGRAPHGLDHAAVSRVLTGKRILITGAGGSIGSELARIAAAFNPEELILMERAENALFEIDRQIASRFPSLRRRAVLHDVTDPEQTLRLLVELRPHVVFHAAAHKHVPLMEDHPAHAVTNNLFGTKSIADAAAAVGAERFVMISSDKAVNPSSVMGATKRLAEIYVRWLGSRPGVGVGSGMGEGGGGTRCSMVRFGNVLGSACSVLTIWAQQIAEGGPITVTDERMTRFFMTIPEAATLVIQSAALEQSVGGAGSGGTGVPPVLSSLSTPGSTDSGGTGVPPVRNSLSLPQGAPVFVLDMGQPVRIVDLAERFVRAHGFTPRLRPAASSASSSLPAPRGTLDITFTGTRPGEKLHEELAYDAELLRPAGYPGINFWAGPAPEGDDVKRISQMVAEMSAVRHSHDRRAVLAALRRYVPTLPAAE